MRTNQKLTKLYLLVITLPKGKKEIIGDLLEPFDVTCFATTLAHGAYSTELSKELMFCIVKEGLVKDAIFAVEDKFNSFHSKISMVYAIPLNSIIGLSNYMALTNGGKKQWKSN